jgi:hypothetical protein
MSATHIAVLLIAIVLISGGASLSSSISTRRNLRSGLGSHDDLMDYTGLYDRVVLLRLPGVSEAKDGGLTFDPAFYDQLPRTEEAKILGAPLGDALSMLVALATPFLALFWDGIPWPSILAALAYQIAGWLWALWGMMRPRDEALS